MNVAELDIDKCSGCGLCASVCSKHSISIVPDDSGFLRPIVDKNTCVDCGLCVKRCVIVNPRKQTIPQKTYAAIRQDKDRIALSSSGGVFAAVAEYVLLKKTNWVVVGSTLDETVSANHIIVDNVDKTVTEGEEYAPLAGVRIDDLYNSSAPIGFTITDEAGNVVASMTGDEVKNYGGNPEDIKVTLENAGNYKVHYEYEAPGMTVTETVNGIDVSHWQNDAGGIDWGAVADAGYKFAMIKVAGRSIGDDGNLYEDNYFRYNIEQATANGIKVGVYFFSQALSVQEAYEEASYTLNLIKDYNITYPVAFDWETSSGYRTCDRLNKDELTSICEAFCDTVKSHGYQPMIYMSKNDWVNKVHTNKLTSKYNCMVFL